MSPAEKQLLAELLDTLCQIRQRYSSELQRKVLSIADKLRISLNTKYVHDYRFRDIIQVSEVTDSMQDVIDDR